MALGRSVWNAAQHLKVVYHIFPSVLDQSSTQLFKIQLTFFIQAVQTPKQRIANEKYYKKHEKQRGKAKPAAKKELPISKGWFSK